MARRLPALLLLTLLGTTGCTTVAPSAVPDDDRAPHAPATGPLPAGSARGPGAPSSGRTGADGERGDERRADHRRGDDRRSDARHDQHERRVKKEARLHEGIPPHPPADAPPPGHPAVRLPDTPGDGPGGGPWARRERHVQAPAAPPAEEREKPPAAGIGGMKGLCDQADKVTNTAVSSLCHKAYG